MPKRNELKPNEVKLPELPKNSIFRKRISNREEIERRIKEMLRNGRSDETSSS